MSSIDHQPLPKMRATTTAADTYDTAVALAELLAAFVSFRWHQPSHPLHKDVNSAVSPMLAARQLGGSIAILAANVVSTTTFIAF